LTDHLERWHGPGLLFLLTFLRFTWLHSYCSLKKKKKKEEDEEENQLKLCRQRVTYKLALVGSKERWSFLLTREAHGHFLEVVNLVRIYCQKLIIMNIMSTKNFLEFLYASQCCKIASIIVLILIDIMLF
jgi:hypothetical protein